MSLSKKYYAPVIIPTLNRHIHLKECIESLEKCTGADKTDVYVALDYPPSDRYVDGWKKIDEYLTYKEGENGFSKLVVIRRERNCGIVGNESNYSLLKKFILERYDRFISTEDDNVFSPNFLEYVNDGLEKYKNDPNCVAVCGYNYNGVTLKDYNDNCYLSREYSTWGIGFWKEKRLFIDSLINEDYAKSIMASWNSIWTIYKNEPRLLNTIIMNLDCGRIFGDTVVVSYQYLNNKYSLFPTVSKVRNLGFDGSGTTIFETDDSFMKQEIDYDPLFECDIVDESSIDIAMPEIRKHWSRSVFMNIVILIRCFIYWITQKDILYLEVKRRNKALFK